MKIAQLVAICLALAVSPNVNAVPLYKATRLDFSATALNNRGQIVGSRDGSAVLWQRGQTLSLGAGTPVDINNRGTVLGSDWLWNSHDGRIEPGFTNAVAINNKGEVVGNEITGFGAVHAYTWDPKHGANSVLIEVTPGFPEKVDFATDISNAGTVAFFFDLKGGMGVWNNQTDYQLLPNLFGCCTTHDHPVFNDGGYLAGITLTGGEPDVIAELIPDLPPFIDDCGSNGCDAITIWTPDLQPIYIGLANVEGNSPGPWPGPHVTGLNDDLLVVGSYVNFEHGQNRAYVGSADFGVLDLNSLLRPRPQALLGNAYLWASQGINDRGWIIAKTQDGDSYLLRPVPEPSTVLMFLGALLLVCARHARRVAVTFVHTTCGSALALACTLASSSLANATPVPTFKIIDLGFEGTALNNRGQVAGYTSSGAVLRDRNGTIHELGGGAAVDVNEFGLVLGNENGHAWIWDPVFGRRDFDFGGATAINDRGQFVGTRAPCCDFEGYLYDPIFGLTPIAPIHRGVIFPLDVNNQGTAVGYDDAGTFGPAYVARDGVATLLTVMEATGGVFGQSYRATAINQRGQIAGFAATNDLAFPGGRDCVDGSSGGECNPAVLWGPDNTPQLLGIFGQALALSDRGQVVGVSGRDACVVCKDVFVGAFLWDESFGALDINSLIRARDPVRNVHLDSATRINNASMVLARSGASSRYLLVRVSEPGMLESACLVLVVFAALSVARRRSRLGGRLRED